jgi:dolichyl-phosphate beta-glucosyltransferase
MVLVSDADLSTPIEEIEKLSGPIMAGECGVAIGSRALALSTILQRQPWWRQGMGRIFNRIVRLLVLDGFADTQCGFKLFEGEVARELFREARVNRFAYDVEILLLALLQGHRVAEIPIVWINSPESRVNPVKDSLQMLGDLCRIRMRLGRYRDPETLPGHPPDQQAHFCAPLPGNSLLKKRLILGGLR